MNVSCPDCRSIFRVDPAKVPPQGVRARCSVCSGVITIPAPSGQATPNSGSAGTASPPSSTVERGRTAPAAQPGWDSPPYGTQAGQTSAAPPAQRGVPPRAAEAPAANRSPREGSSERGPVTATATPPSPTSGVREFTAPPPLPPFNPGATAAPPATAFTPPSPATA